MVCLSVADPDLQIRVHPDSEIRGGSRGCGSVVSKNFFQPSWPLFGLKIKGGWPLRPLLWMRHRLCWNFARPRSHEIQVTPQNPAKFTKTRKILRNLVKILSNRCLYNVFETYFSYWGYLLAVNLQIYLETSSLKRANDVVKLPGIDYVAKSWALAMMLKALPLVHFLSVLSLKEQMITAVRKTLKTLVWSGQNRSISSEICLENNHKIGRCLPIAFWRSLPWNFLRNWLIFPRICP